MGVVINKRFGKFGVVELMGLFISCGHSKKRVIKDDFWIFLASINRVHDQKVIG